MVRDRPARIVPSPRRRPKLRVQAEHHYHELEDVRAYLRDAIALCDELEVPAEQRVELLPKLVELLSNKQVVLEQGPPIGVAAGALGLGARGM